MLPAAGAMASSVPEENRWRTTIMLRKLAPVGVIWALRDRQHRPATQVRESLRGRDRHCLRRLLAVALAGLSLAAAIPVGAGSASTTMLVSAIVISVCTISATPMSFGNYNPLSASPNDATATVTITCSQGTAATIGLDNGLNASGSTRRMTLAGSFLTYEVYKDSGRTAIWGNSGSDLLDAGTAPSVLPRNFTAYGRITSGQSAPAAVSVSVAPVTATVNF
jgi:spore coat protein U-like protein